MKKMLIALVLVLVVAASVVLGVTLAKKEEPKQEALLTYTIYNRTGENLKSVTISDRKSDSKMSVSSISDGISVGLGLTAVIENNAPDLILNFVTESSEQFTTVVTAKDSPITLLPIHSEGDVVTFSEPQA